MSGRWMSCVWLAAGMVCAEAGCHRDAAVETPRRLAAERLTLEYPATWRIASQQGRNEGLFMGIHEVVGTGSVRAFITIYDAQAPFAAEDVAVMHLNALPDELADKAVTESRRVPVTARVGDQSVTGLAVHFTVPEGARPVPYTIQAFTVQNATRTGTVVTQVADADLPGAQVGLDLVLRSLTILPSKPASSGVGGH